MRYNLDGAAIEVLRQLAAKPRWDGNLASKTGRDTLVANKLAFRHEGFNFITLDGAIEAHDRWRLDKLIGT